MQAHADKIRVKKNQSGPNAVSQKKIRGEFANQCKNNRSESVIQRELQGLANDSPQAKEAAQLQSMADNYSPAPLQLVQRKENIKRHGS